MDENRRRFLKKAGYASLGLGCGLPFLSTGCSTAKRGSASQRQWAMVIDVEKCRTEEVRRACWEACHREHNVPFIPDPNKPNPDPGNPEDADPEEEVKWIWEADYKHVFPDQSHQHLSVRDQPVLALCNHCTNPPCVKVCPTKATWRRKEDGIVVMDMHRCIGCRYCIAACPYGARSFNWRDPREKGTDPNQADAYGKYLYFWKDKMPADTLPSEYPTRTIGVVEKCNFCAELLREQLQERRKPTPACVKAAREVPGGQGALTFGDLTQPGSRVSQILSDKDTHTIARRVGLGTGPNVFYVI